MRSAIGHQRGIGLIEVLITLLIVAIGLLGTAQLQLINLQNSRSSDARTIATLLAGDLSERMRANRLGSTNGSYMQITTSGGQQGSAPLDPNCDSCNANQQADKDVREWLENLVDVNGVGSDGDDYIPMIPNATATLTGNAASARFTLTINWQEQDNQLKQWVNRSYVQEFEL